MEELKSVQGFYLTRMGDPLLWGVQREKRGSRSSYMTELKAMDEGIKGIQYLRHLMKQLGLSDVSYPTPILNDNRGSIDWIESGCKPTKKLRHKNLAELGIAEARQHGEVSFLWIPGATNPSEAAAGSIRADFADSIEENIVHGSDGPETAAQEIKFFFNNDEICKRTRK